MIDVITKNGVTGQFASVFGVNQKLDVNALRPYVNLQDGRSYVTVCKPGADPMKPESYSAQQIGVNATLCRDEWKELDRAVLKASRSRLVGFEDLTSRGLVYNLGNAMATTVFEYNDASNAFTADVSMDGLAKGQNDRMDYATHYIPIPIVHVDYSINLRHLEASRRMGNPLDTNDAEQASRAVAERLEKMLWDNTPYTFGGGTIYGYTNHPKRNTYTLAKAWTAATGPEIFKDVLAMKAKSIEDMQYGPWMLYIPQGYEIILEQDYDPASQNVMPIRERIMRIENLQGIKVVDMLPADTVLLVQMTSDTVRVINGIPIQNIMWKTEGNFVENYKVMTIQVPQIRADYYGHSGIVHASR